jgi:gluconate 2-dehydrogenase gamma chain
MEQLAMLGVLAATYPATALAQARLQARESQRQPGWLKADPWKTLSEVQQHLFPPAEDTPGASDINAIVYLYNTLENPAADGEDREFMVNGVGWLNELVQEKYRQSFVTLDTAQRETVLRQIEQSGAGERWLSLLLTYLMEALLADPVYGGNPDGVGWKWLEHQPGFPAPPSDKSWYRLAAPVRYQRKA